VYEEAVNQVGQAAGFEWADDLLRQGEEEVVRAVLSLTDSGQCLRPDNGSSLATALSEWGSMSWRLAIRSLTGLSTASVAPGTGASSKSRRPEGLEGERMRGLLASSSEPAAAWSGFCAEA
jgi:hypothetical protein